MAYIEILSLIAKLVTSGAVIFGLLWTIFTFLERQKVQDIQIKNIKEEQQVMCYGMLACLDGLKQLGANDNVSKAHDALAEHLNEAAHRE